MGIKSLAVAQYILDKQKSQNNTMTPMQLIKVAYIAHGISLGLFGRALLDEQVEAWPYGPVVRSIYSAVAGQGSRSVEQIIGVTSNYSNILSEEEKNILNHVCKTYGNIPGFTLSDATHREGTPWDITMKEIGGFYPPISDDLIEQFYKSNVIGKSHDRL